ncbi:MAG: glycosyltransferase, partial [Nitrososphaerales archaeon]
IDNEEELARSLHKSATVYRLPEYFPEQYDLSEFLGYSLSTLPQRLYSALFSMGVNRQFDEPIRRLPWGARQLLQYVAGAWYKRVIKIRQDGLANHRYWNIYLAQQLPPAMYEKYKDVILLDCFDYLFFIQTLIINKSVEPIDAVFCNDLSTLSAGCLIKEVLGAKLIFDSHEVVLYGFMNPRHKPIAEANERWMYTLCDRFITVSDSRAEYFVRRCPSLKPLVIVNHSPFPWNKVTGTPPE